MILVSSGLPGGPLGGLLGRLGGLLGASRAVLGHLEAILGGRLGCISGRLGDMLGPSWGLLQPSWAPWSRLGTLLEGYWTILAVKEAILGPSRAARPTRHAPRRAVPKPQGEF